MVLPIFSSKASSLICKGYDLHYVVYQQQYYSFGKTFYVGTYRYSYYVYIFLLNPSLSCYTF